MDDGNVTAQVISGKLQETQGAFDTLTEIHLAVLYFKEGGKFRTLVPEENNILCYVIKGEIKINGERISALYLAEFNNDHDLVHLEAQEESIVLFGHARPFDEPVVFGGPFVMNTKEEIEQAYEDYKKGKFE